MRPKVACILAPKATEPILLWLIDKPIAIHMRDALTRDVGADCRIWEARFHDDRADLEWRAGVLTDAVCQLCEVLRRMNPSIDVNA